MKTFKLINFTEGFHTVVERQLVWTSAVKNEYFTVITLMDHKPVLNILYLIEDNLDHYNEII